MNTAGGMVTHMTQVHKEELKKIPNALPGKDTTEIEIFGMEGVPEDDLLAHEGLTPEEIKKAKLEREIEEGNAPAWPGGLLPTPYVPGFVPGPFMRPPMFPGARPPVPGWGGPPVPLPRPGYPGGSLPIPVPLTSLPNMGMPPVGSPSRPFPPSGGFGAPPFSNSLPLAQLPQFGVYPGTPPTVRPGPPGVFPQTGFPLDSNNPAIHSTDGRNSSPPPGFAPQNTFSQQSLAQSQESSEAKLVYADNEISMEEKRAMLTKYQLNYQQDAFKTKVQQLDQSIQSRLSSLEGLFQRN